MDHALTCQAKCAVNVEVCRNFGMSAKVCGYHEALLRGPAWCLVCPHSRLLSSVNLAAGPTRGQPGIWWVCTVVY